MITALCEGGCGRRVQIRDDGTGWDGWCYNCWRDGGHGESSVHHRLVQAATDLANIIDRNGDPTDAIETVQHLINVISSEHALTKQDAKH